MECIIAIILAVQHGSCNCRACCTVSCAADHCDAPTNTPDSSRVFPSGSIAMTNPHKQYIGTGHHRNSKHLSMCKYLDATKTLESRLRQHISWKQISAVICHIPIFAVAAAEISSQELTMQAYDRGRQRLKKSINTLPTILC